MVEATQSAFRRNAQAALQDGTYEDILKALIIKLQELGVPNAETPDEADKINHPLKMAYNKAQTPEQSDLAWNNLSTRILALGSLLPPEAADGAFLADRGEVEELNKKWDDFWSARLWAKMNKESPVGPSHADEQDGDVGAGLLEGGIFSMSREKTSALIKSFYTGDPVANAEVITRAVDRQFFRDAIIGDPSLGSVTTMGVINTDAMNKLIWASEHNPTNDILWAMSRKLVELGKADSIIEQDTVDAIHVLSVARDYAAKREDPLFRRRAIDILRKELIRFVGLLPQGVWKTDFLDDRENILELIGDRVQKSGGVA